MSTIALTSGIRNNLLALQSTKSNISTIQGHLSTGMSVASPIDDAVKYFTAKSLTDRATDLSSRKDSIDQGVSTVTAASDALSSMETLVNQMKGIIDSARSGTDTQRKAYKTQLNTLSSQLQNLVNDASYKGLNLVNSSTSTMTVYFSEKTDSKLTVSGVNMKVSKLFVSVNGTTSLGVSKKSLIVSKLGFTTGSISSYKLSTASALALFNSHADKAQNYLDATISKIRAESANMGSNVAILNVRLDFTKTYINTLQGGSDKMTVADLNSESANLVSLQTRQSLGIQSLSMANQSDQAVLQLFR